ncbi:MAG TPA: alkaline phosphatase family protein [Niabella sp.]|nr:alkaline phosphatase family protein [Niabella sp.]HOZ95600.1 alkaline phosphatase family protein [Niabella sp.]HQW13840.1 alkaline phosphatase family protein [Niabella sp.]HQX19267.1 alkaline phosphatase family protein [Niabella sp.]HQX42110.1 alkaline phosphatase family protein [Niabella sp.]
MKRLNLFFLFAFLSAACFSQSVKRPKLVVGIVADQMRWDYLYRYYDRYDNNGGFKRMLNEGFSCENTFINHLPSYTAVGHTTIFTGSVPAIHGIAGNEWIDQASGKKVYCTDDSTVQTVGSNSRAGRMSPRNLQATTITDELRLATNFRSKVIGVSLKDRASILPAGHNPTGAFWFDDATGKFITSTWYMNNLPKWVNDFNAKDVPSKLTSSPWTTLYPINTYTQSTADDVKWEGTFKGETSPTFPHNLKDLYQKDKDVIRSTPYGNTLTLEFAKAAIAGNNLGNGDATDFLTINCASTDYVGHKYGTNSIEIEDVYLRLDKELGALFRYLDEKVGNGNYLVFLTADHGACHAINFMKEYKMPADFIKPNKIINELNEVLANKFGQEKLVRSDENYQINFDNTKIRELSLDYQAIKTTSLNHLRQNPELQFVIDLENIGSASVPEPIRTMAINGYNTKRSGTIQLIPFPGWFESGYATGTTHGTWIADDTHIPLVWMGWGIKPGKTNRETHMTDIAPTIAALLRIQMPSGNSGKVITEVVQ